MGLDVSKLEEIILSEYREIIAVETVIKKLKENNLPLDIVLDKLDETLQELQERDHVVNFILFDKEEKPYELLGKQCFDDVKYITAHSIKTFKLFFDGYDINEVYEEYYSNKHFSESYFIDAINSLIKNHKIYLLKTDVLALLDNFSIDDNEIILVKNCIGLDGNQSEDWQSEKNFEEFIDSGTCDLAFELWLDDRQGFMDKLSSLSQVNQQIANLQTQITELTAENEHLRSNQAQALPPNEPSPTVSSKSSESKDQMIAIMAGELAKRQNNLRKGTGAINKAELARFLCSSEINTLFKDPKSDETFRQILKPLQLNSNE